MKYASVLLIALSGCWGPQYPEPPENSISAEKGVAGGKLRVRSTANTSVRVQGAKYNPDTRLFEVQDATFLSDQASNQAAQVPLMQQYNAQLGTTWAGFNEFNRQNWAGVNQALSTVAGVVGPLGSQYIQMRGNLGMQRALRPSAIGEVIGLVRNGADPVETMQRWDQVDSRVGEGLRNEFLKREYQYPRSIPLPASQPTP